MARASGSGRPKEYERLPIQEASPKWEGMPKGQAVAEERRLGLGGRECARAAMIFSVAALLLWQFRHRCGTG